MLVRKSIIVDTEETPLLAKWVQDNPRLWPLVVRDLLESLLASGDLPPRLRLKGMAVLGDGTPRSEPRVAEPAAAMQALDVAPAVPVVPAARSASGATGFAGPELDGQSSTDVEPSAPTITPKPAAEPAPSATAPVAPPVEPVVQSVSDESHIPPKPSAAAREAALAALRQNKF